LIWRFDPIPFLGLPLRGFVITHWTQSVGLLRMSDKSVAGNSTWTEAVLKRHNVKLPYSRRVLNSQSQKASGCTPTS